MMITFHMKVVIFIRFGCEKKFETVPLIVLQNIRFIRRVNNQISDRNIIVWIQSYGLNKVHHIFPNISFFEGM